MLREIWDRLTAEGSALADTTELLKHSRDAAALEAHRARLREHYANVRACNQAMEAFHKRYGPVGGLDEGRGS